MIRTKDKNKSPVFEKEKKRGKRKKYQTQKKIKKITSIRRKVNEGKEKQIARTKDKNKSPTFQKEKKKRKSKKNNKEKRNREEKSPIFEGQ